MRVVVVALRAARHPSSILGKLFSSCFIDGCRLSDMLLPNALGGEFGKHQIRPEGFFFKERLKYGKLFKRDDGGIEW